jgi:hypothetical protein
MVDNRWRRLYREQASDIVLAVALTYVFVMFEAGTPSLGGVEFSVKKESSRKTSS